MTTDATKSSKYPITAFVVTVRGVPESILVNNSISEVFIRDAFADWRDLMCYIATRTPKAN